jgi:hypothetical protein
MESVSVLQLARYLIFSKYPNQPFQITFEDHPDITHEKLYISQSKYECVYFFAMIICASINLVEPFL